MILQRTILGAVTLSLAAFAAASAQERTSSKDPYQKKYQILYQQNMFLRNRVNVEVDPPDPTLVKPPPPIPPEENLVLRGIACEGEGAETVYYAFVEDLTAQMTTKIRVGDVVAGCQGKLIKPTLESVEYEKGGKTVQISLGQNLTGADATPVPEAAPVPPPPAMTTQPMRTTTPWNYSMTVTQPQPQPQPRTVVTPAPTAPTTPAAPAGPKETTEERIARLKLQRLKEQGR